MGLIRGKDGIYRARSPEQAVAILNEIVLNDMDTELYFTILLVEADLCTGHMRMSQAGHPHPAVQRADGTVEFPGNGGLPVGLIPGAEFDSFEVQLEAGDRLLLTSDGVTECADPAGNLLDDDGLAQILVSHQWVQELEFFDVMIDALTEYSKSPTFDDDVSAVMLEFKRSGANPVTQTSS